MFFAVSLSLCFALAASAATNATSTDNMLCGPNQHEMHLQASGGMVYMGHAVPVDYTGMSYYDYDRKMMRTDVMSYDEKTRMTTNYSIIYDYNKHIRYTLQNNGCKKENYTMEMSPPCLPANHTMLGTTIIGTERHNIDAAVYFYYLPEFNSNIRAVVSLDGTPLASTYYPLDPNGVQQTIIFSEYSSRIRDSNVFNIPSMCSMS